MQIEVPSDLYDDAVRAMESRIREGRVPGVDDAARARELVRKGAFTYQQARNIAKFGTVESITYDAVNGVKVAGTALGVSFAVTFLCAVWNGEDLEAALERAVHSGLRVGGTAWLATIATSQLARTGIESSLRPATDFVVGKLGPQAAAALANSIRSGAPIYGAAAMSHVSKVLRGNIVTGVVTTMVLSSADIARLVRGRISRQQAFKNITTTAAGTAGGTGGWVAGAAAGAAIGSVVPVIGTSIGGVVGGLIGAFAGGSIASATSKLALAQVIEDDASAILALLEAQLVRLAEGFLLNEKELREVVEALSLLDMDKEVRNIYAAEHRTAHIVSLLKPLSVGVVARRTLVELPAE